MRTIILLLGAPGVGKGTHASLLKKWLRVPHISTGDLLRDMGGSSETLERMNAGGLASDGLVNSLVAVRIAQPDCVDGFIFDGYPRNLSQALHFRKQLRYLDNLVVIEIAVEEEKLFARLLNRGRSDDREEVIRERLRVCRQETSPVIDYYRTSQCFFRINGMASVADVAEAVRSAVKQGLGQVAGHVA